MASNSVCVVLLCGLPGSGKTYISTVLSSIISKSDVDVSIIRSDDIEHSLAADLAHGDGGGAYDPQIWKDAQHKTMDTLVTSMMTNHTERHHIYIIDDNMAYRSMRKRYVRLARNLSIGICCIYVKVDVDLCILRNRSRVQPVPECVIVNMAKYVVNDLTNDFSRVLEPPTEHEGFSFVYVYENGDISDVVRRIYEEGFVVSNTLQVTDEEQKNSDRCATQENIIHQVDLSLRKDVNRVISASPPSQRRDMFGTLDVLASSS